MQARPVLLLTCCGLLIGCASAAALGQQTPADRALQQHYEIQRYGQQALQPSRAQMEEAAKGIQEMQQEQMRRWQQQSELMQATRSAAFQPPPQFTPPNTTSPERTDTAGPSGSVAASVAPSPGGVPAATVPHSGSGIRWIVFLSLMCLVGVWVLKLR